MPYPITETGAPKVNRTAIVLLLLLGLLVFGICFAIGYYGGTLLGPH
jgi:hypothetical protein